MRWGFGITDDRGKTTGGRSRTQRIGCRCGASFRSLSIASPQRSTVQSAGSGSTW